MNRLFVPLLISIFAPASIWAVNVTCVEGGLAKAVADPTVADLTVSGALDVRDFNFIANNMTSLTTLDISEVEVKGYTCTGSEAYFGNRGTFDANEIPALSFFDSKLESVKLPKAIESIGSAAFAGCDNLKSIELPATLTSISDNAFQESGLTSLSVNSTDIGDKAFAACAALTTVNLGAAVESIGEKAFVSCPALTTVNIADDNELNNIGSEAFANTALTAFDFTKCTKMANVGSWAFAGAPIVEANLPANGLDVAEGVFFGNSAADSIYIPDNATTIGNYAYYGITGVDKAFIPYTVTYIGDNAFENAGFESVRARPELPPALGKDVFKGLNDNGTKVTLFVKGRFIEGYRTAEQWRDFYVVVDPIIGVEGVFADNSLKAYFTDKVLNIIATDNIASIAVADETGVAVAVAEADGDKATIDTEAMMGHVYMVSVTLADGSKHNIKLMRK